MCMTAVVGILNKSAVALAADSAVTITGPNGKKIFNTANKIFTLSKFHPVGIMVYSSASFMGHPWEILIKSYRKHLGEKSFPLLNDYRQDFIRYLKDKIDLVSPGLQEKYFVNQIHLFYDYLLKSCIQAEKDALEGRPNEEQIQYLKEALKKRIREVEHPRWEREPPSIEFEDYVSLSVFLDEKKPLIAPVFQRIFQHLNMGEEVRHLFEEMAYHFIRSRFFVGGYTGLVFAGYGEDEFYPGCIPIEVGGVVDNRIRYNINQDQQVHINDEVIGAIRPFAQTDVINTFIQGMDPTLDTIFVGAIKQFLAQYTTYLIRASQEGGFDLSAILQNLDLERVVEELNRSIQEAKHNKHVIPTMNTVSILSKEDLAEMAESLIYLTFLKRRISFAEESVGGPVDVALISKGDGFVWIKRKHYFEPELNYQFFQNYFKI